MRHTTGAMFITNHVLAGALAGTASARAARCSRSCVGFATHVAMDMTPHWGNPTIGRDGFFAVAKRDGILGLGVVALVTAAGRAAAHRAAGRDRRRGDARRRQAGEFFFGFNPLPRWLDRFHKRIQRESPEGMRTEVAAGVALADDRGRGAGAGAGCERVAAGAEQSRCGACGGRDRVVERAAEHPLRRTATFQSTIAMSLFGGRGVPVTSTMSPRWLQLKNHSAFSLLRLMQPCETLSRPWAPTDHGAACTYSPVEEICVSQKTSSR